MESQFTFKIPTKKKEENTSGIFTKSNVTNPFTQTTSSANPFRMIASKNSGGEETEGVFSLGSKESTTTITNPFAGNSKPSFLGARQTNDTIDASVANKQRRPLFGSKTLFKDQTISSKTTRNPFAKTESASKSIEQRTQLNPLAKPAITKKWIAPTMDKNERQRPLSPYREKNEMSDTVPRSRFMDRIEKQGKESQNAANTRSRISIPEKPLQARKQHTSEVKQFNSTKPNITNALTREMSSIISALIELKSRHCTDDYSRYIILDERDKLLYRWRTEMDKNSPRVGKKMITGTLPSMCAEKERYARLVQKRIASYECDGNGEVEASRLVKEYSRSAADQEKPLPHELRKPEMLRYTMNYLLTNILDFFDPFSDELGSWYNFLWDRTRAIRKEITQLMLSNELAVSLLESCTRFHIICAYLLCSQDVDKFDQKMNTENLGKSLQTLRHLYEDLAKKGIYCSSEAEFRSYDVLLHLQDSNVLRQVLSYRKEVRDDKCVRLSIQLASAMQTNNFTKFFRLLRNEATYLQCCVCHRFFTQVRSKALAVMARSYGRNPSFNIQHLSLILAFDDEKNALDIMGEYGIYVNDMNSEEVDFTREHLNTDADPQMVTYKWVDVKNICRLSETVNGGPVKVCNEVPKIFDSFDARGYYTQDPILNEFLKPFVNLNDEKLYSQTQQKEVEVLVDPTLAKRKAAEEEKRKFEEEQLQKARDRERHRMQLVQQQQEEARKQKELERLQKVEEEKRIQLEKMRREELRKQELRQHTNLLVSSLYERIEIEAVEELLKCSVAEIFARTKKEQEKCRMFVETASNQLIKSIADRELKCIVKTAVNSRRKEVEMTLSKVKTRLSLLWLRQFWDQWRAHVEAVKASRKRRSKAWEEFTPSWNSSCFAPALYLHSSSPTTKENRPPLEAAQRLALAHFKRKRIERLSRLAFEQWRSYVREKTLERKQAEILVAQSKSFISRRSNVSERSNDISKLKRVFHFNSNSPIRKSAKLTLEESFSFPTLRKSDLLDETDKSYDANPFETSVLTEEDVAIARRELERSSLIWAKKSDIKPFREVDAAGENKNETIELFDECLQGQRRFQNLKSRAADLAESIREHESFMNSLLDTVIHKRNSILDHN